MDNAQLMMDIQLSQKSMTSLSSIVTVYITTQNYYYRVIVYFFYIMSQSTAATAIVLDIDWDYTMAWFPASLLKHEGTHRHSQRRCAYCLFTLR